MLLRTEFYNDFLRPAGDIAAGGGVLFGRDGNRLSVLGGNVRLRDEERLLPRWMEIVRLIAPHLEAGFAIRRRIEGTTLSALASTGLGPKGPVALLALDRKRRCLFANRSARRMMERGEPLGIDPSGRVRGATPDTNIALMQSCARLAAEAGRMAERVALEDRGGRRTHAAEVMHFDPRHFRENPFGSFFGFDRPCQVLVLPEAEETGPTARERFAARHGLTVREAEIAEGVADGLTPAELALRDGVSPHTVRNQVKSVLSKSGLRRQAELAALFERERRIGEDPS
jgi:DNA-binding CsgD family transcriptional regulator